MFKHSRVRQSCIDSKLSKAILTLDVFGAHSQKRLQLSGALLAACSVVQLIAVACLTELPNQGGPTGTTQQSLR